MVLLLSETELHSSPGYCSKDHPSQGAASGDAPSTLRNSDLWTYIVRIEAAFRHT